MDNKGTMHRPLIGGSALIVIFAVLCLVTFSLLMLVTENSAYRLSEVSADANHAYYEADRKAEATFASIRSGSIPSHVTQEDNCFTYTEQISDTKLLHVKVECIDGEWTVLRWQALSTVR